MAIARVATVSKPAVITTCARAITLCRMELALRRTVTWSHLTISSLMGIITGVSEVILLSHFTLAATTRAILSLSQI